MKSFGTLLYQSFRGTYGPVVSIIGIGLAVLTFYTVPAEDTIPLRHVIVAGSAGFYILTMLVHTAYSAYQQRGTKLPKVRYAADPPKGYNPAVALLLLEPSQLFVYDAMVATYIQTNDIEHLIGLGKVINIQENGNIQVLITRDLQYPEEWAEITKNNIVKLKSLLVKPTVPGFAMEATSND